MGRKRVLYVSLWQLGLGTGKCSLRIAKPGKHHVPYGMCRGIKGWDLVELFLVQVENYVWPVATHMDRMVKWDEARWWTAGICILQCNSRSWLFKAREPHDEEHVKVYLREKKNKDWLVWLQRQTEPLWVTVMGARPPRNKVTVWNKTFKDGWQQNSAFILLGPFLRSTSILKTFKIVALLQSPNLSVSYITISNF